MYVCRHSTMTVANSHIQHNARQVSVSRHYQRCRPRRTYCVRCRAALALIAMLLWPWAVGRRFVFNIRRTTNGAACGYAHGAVLGVGTDHNTRPAYYPPENFIYQAVHFGEYLCNNWSTEWVHFALLNTNVEAFLNQLSY